MRWFLAAVGVVLIGVAVGIYFIYSATAVEVAFERGEEVGLLLVGVDTSSETGPHLFFVSVFEVGADPEADDPYRVLSFPTDLLLRFGDGWSTVESIYFEGGIEALKEAVESLLEAWIDYWVIFDQDDLMAFVEGVGGVELAVEESVDWVDPGRGIHIRIPQGAQKLDGKLSFAFVRYLGPEGEEKRIKRQHLFFRALWSRIKELDLGEVVALSLRLLPELETDLKPEDVKCLLEHLVEFPVEGRFFGVVPGVMADEYGGVMPDVVKLRWVLTRHGEREAVRILVLNGTDEPFLARKARAMLVRWGFEVFMGRTKGRDHPETVLIPLTIDEVERERVVGHLSNWIEFKVASSEGYKGELPHPLPEGTDFVLILGRDFERGD